MTTTLLVGCGNMGRAILDGWLGGGIDPASITVLDPAANEVPDGVTLLREAPRGGQFAAIVLAVKPQQLAETAAAVRPVAEGAVVLSILAGTDLARLRAQFPGSVPARMMANLAAAFGRSPVALFAGSDLDDPRRALIEALMRPLGTVEWLATEDHLHAVTALGGSGPGFVYRFLDALAAGGAELGLAPDQAARIALATMRGAAELAARSPDSFAGLANRVASKGGTTEAGLRVLDADAALVSLVAQTLRAARDRSEELGRR